MMTPRSFFISLYFLLFTALSFGQEVYVNVQNTSIYEFIDELANCQIISLNSVIKPYSRVFIAEILNDASKNTTKLNKRQRDELAFYLKDYSKELPGFQTTDYLGKNFISKRKVPFKKRIDLFYYKDSLFTFTLNPILGLSYYKNENGTNYHRWNGAEAYATVGKHWGFYASLRDNHESELFAEKEYLTQQTGGSFKGDGKGGGDYEEMKGGITYSWSWGSVGLVKDNITWGNNYHGANIISDRAPSFPFLKFHAKPVKWFELNYIHGWLSSLVIDSSRTYNYGSGANTGTRIVYRDKYIAANMLTFTPFKKLDISFGNSIIYSDIGINLGYLIPIMFFKAIDHSQNGLNDYAGQNAQMFFDISSRQINHLHLYSSLFIDEINLHNMWNKAKETNFISFKGGFALSDFPLQNVTLIAEYTHTNPITYKHNVPTTTYETDLFNMGNYLRDNAEEYYYALQYKPIRGLQIELSYLNAMKGPDYPYIKTGNVTNVLGLPFLSVIEWSEKNISCKVSHEVFNDIFVFASFSNSFIMDIQKIYEPEYFLGNTNTINVGMNWGY